MAATAWKFYDQAKKKIANNKIPLDAGVFKMILATSASNAATLTLSVKSQITSEIAATGGYVTGGRNLASITWAAAGSPSSVKWDAADLVFTANGANLTNVRYAVIRNSVAAASGHLLVWSALSTAQFTVTTGNTLTVQFATGGIFTLI